MSKEPEKDLAALVCWERYQPKPRAWVIYALTWPLWGAADLWVVRRAVLGLN